jgi:inorganic pyrophosphatase
LIEADVHRSSRRWPRKSRFYILPAGNIFPFEFGFIPSTLGEDGDPLDILVLIDSPTCVGCILGVRAIGVIEAEQTQQGNTFRNDRLIGVALAAHQRAELKALAKLEASTITEIEHFFMSYNEMRGHQFKPTRRAGAAAALQLVRQGVQKLKSGKSRSQ